MTRRWPEMFESVLLLVIAVAFLTTGTSVGLVLGAVAGVVAVGLLVLWNHDATRKARRLGSRATLVVLVAVQVYRGTHSSTHIAGCVAPDHETIAALAGVTSGAVDLSDAKGVHAFAVHELLYVAAPLTNGGDRWGTWTVDTGIGYIVHPIDTSAIAATPGALPAEPLYQNMPEASTALRCAKAAARTRH